jgi:hypothetical protein
MKLIHKTLDFEVKQVGDPKDRTLEFVGSTAKRIKIWPKHL